MPVKLSHVSESTEARIEIVPLIDIMFFLLASFMLVSLSLVHARTVKVQLPAASSARADAMKHTATVSVDAAGRGYFDAKFMPDEAMLRALEAAKANDPSLRVVVAGDRAARHGDVIRVLDLIRLSGVDEIGFDVRPADKGNK